MHFAKVKNYQVPRLLASSKYSCLINSSLSSSFVLPFAFSIRFRCVDSALAGTIALLPAPGSTIKLLMLLAFLLKFFRKCSPWGLSRPRLFSHSSPCRPTYSSLLTLMLLLSQLAFLSSLISPRKDPFCCLRARLEALCLSVGEGNWPNRAHLRKNRTWSSRSKQ